MAVESKITRMLTFETPSTAQLLRRPLQPRKQFHRKRSRSMESIRCFRNGIYRKLMEIILFYLTSV